MGDEVKKDKVIIVNNPPVIEDNNRLIVNSGLHIIEDFDYYSFELNGGQLNAQAYDSIDGGEVHGGEIFFKSFSIMENVTITGGKTCFYVREGFKNWMISGGDNHMESHVADGKIAINGGTTTVEGNNFGGYFVELSAGVYRSIGRSFVSLKNVKSDGGVATIYFSQKTPKVWRGKNIEQSVYIADLPDKLYNVRFVFEKADLKTLKKQFTEQGTLCDQALFGHYRLTFSKNIFKENANVKNTIMSRFATTDLSWDEFKKLPSGKVLKNIQFAKK